MDRLTDSHLCHHCHPCHLCHLSNVGFPKEPLSYQTWDNTVVHLSKHLLKTLCTDLANTLVRAVAQDHLLDTPPEEGGQMTSEVGTLPCSSWTSMSTRVLWCGERSPLLTRQTEVLPACCQLWQHQAVGSALGEAMTLPWARLCSYWSHIESSSVCPQRAFATSSPSV